MRIGVKTGAPIRPKPPAEPVVGRSFDLLAFKFDRNWSLP
jgi:hypothetical protein